MKTNSFLIGSLLAGMVISTACNQNVDEALDVQGDRAITFNFSVANTRTSMGNDHTTTFVNSDVVGVFATKDASAEMVYSNFAYRYDGNNWSAVNETLGVPADNSALDFYAYYPYNGGANALSFDFSVQTDQSAEGGLGKSDLLLGYNKDAAAGASQVALGFNHVFALVEVSLKGFTEDEVRFVELRAVTEAGVDFTVENPSATVKNDAAAAFIKMAKGSNVEGNVVYRAIVPAQTLNIGKTLFRVVTSETAYQHAIINEVNLKANGIQPFTISKAVDLVEIGMATSGIGDWDVFTGDTPELPTEQNMILANLHDMVVEDVLSLTNVQQLTNGSVANENRWFNGNDGEGKEPAPAAITIENGVLQVDGKHCKNGSSMWESYTGYTLTNAAAAMYELIFEAKMVENANIEGQRPILKVSIHKESTTNIVSNCDGEEFYAKDFYTTDMDNEWQTVKLQVDMETIKIKKSIYDDTEIEVLTDPVQIEKTRKKFSIYLRPKRAIFQFRNFVFRRVENNPNTDNGASIN